MYALAFYVPAASLETVKSALFAAGAGRIGNYEHCCWETVGQGQFRPLAGSTPALGTHGKLETVEEYRVEMVCEEKHLQAAVAALKAAHPYEEPAYQVVKMVTEFPG